MFLNFSLGRRVGGAPYTRVRAYMNLHPFQQRCAVRVDRVGNNGVNEVGKGTVAA